LDDIPIFEQLWLARNEQLVIMEGEVGAVQIFQIDRAATGSYQGMPARNAHVFTVKGFKVNIWEETLGDV